MLTTQINRKITFIVKSYFILMHCQFRLFLLHTDIFFSLKNTSLFDELSDFEFNFIVPDSIFNTFKFELFLFHLKKEHLGNWMSLTGGFLQNYHVSSDSDAEIKKFLPNISS